MLSTYLQFLQVQTQTGKMKLEYLRRREEREEKESVQRREMERMKLEREAAEFEHSKHSATTKQKADRAIVGFFFSFALPF
jgi:histone acetyltransferase MYST4